MADVMQDWASLELLGVLLWAMRAEYRQLRREARRR